MISLNKNLNREDFLVYSINEDAQEKFFTIFRHLSKQIGCYYMAYVHEDLYLKRRASFATNPDWLKRYIGDQLINDCHLWLEVTKSFILTDKKHLILPWDSISPQNRKQKSILYERMDHEIGANGVSFCSENNGIVKYLAICPDLKNIKFQEHLSKNINAVRQATYQLRQLISEHTLKDFSEIAKVD